MTASSDTQRTVSATALNVVSHSDQTTGLFDSFAITLGIPAQQTVFPDRVEVRLDASRSKGIVTLYANSLVAITESWPNTREVLFGNLGSYDWADLIMSFVTAPGARSMLLLDPNFFMIEDGHAGLRTWDDVREFVEQPSQRDRFVPEIGEYLNGGNPLGNTLEVPSGLPPGFEGQWAIPRPELTVARFSALLGNSGRAPAGFRSPPVLQFPTYGADGLLLESGFTFQQTFRPAQLANAPTSPLGSMTIQMDSPCLSGMVDLYIDMAFGVYLPVLRSAGFVAESATNAGWYARFCQGAPQAKPYLMACDTDSDCASKLCVNSRCAPPACSPDCATGQGCGVGYQYPGDCTSGICELGVCSDARD